MAKGYKFEDDVKDYLLAGFDVISNYMAASAEQGKRREIDLIAIKEIPPFGETSYLIECKTVKIGEAQVKTFKDKLDDIKRGGDRFSNGIPIMISKEGFTSGAIDEAKKSGIKLMSYEELQSADIPIPRNIEIQLHKLQTSNENAIQHESYFDIENLGSFTYVKSNLDYNIKGLGNFDIFFELVKGTIRKESMYVFGKYIGPVNEDSMRNWIQKIEGYIKSIREKGSRITTPIIGFFTKSVTDDDKKIINRVKNSTDSYVSIIDENFKLYGNLAAKKIFTP